VGEGWLPGTSRYRTAAESSFRSVTLGLLRHMKRRVAILTALCWLGCSRPERPADVAPAAYWVESAKTGYWQVCWTTEVGGVHCTIWNGEGTILMDEGYLPLDGGPAPTKDALSINGTSCGPYEVCLDSGRVLLPQSMFERSKALFQGRRYWRPPTERIK